MEFGIDPMNWNVGVNFGMGGGYMAMFSVGPLYLIVWPKGHDWRSH